MHTAMKSVVAFAFGAAFAAFISPVIRPGVATAAEAAAAEQYKVLNYDLRSNGPSERDLNRLSSDGWRVRSAGTGFVILAK